MNIEIKKHQEDAIQYIKQFNTIDITCMKDGILL